MYGGHWSVGDVLFVFFVLLFIIAFVLVWSVVTRKDCELEQNRANVLRAQLLTLLAIAGGVLVWVTYRKELTGAVQHLLA